MSCVRVFGSVRRALLLLLVLSFVLTAARQSLDFIGRVWLCIALNFVHMFFLILGLFGAAQFRPPYLVCAAFWLPVCLLWNVFLVCYHLNVEPLDRQDKLLSFGSRLSKSFWLERMPLCQYSYNHTVARWQRPDNCILPYYYAEITTAILNFVVVFMAFLLTLVYMCTYTRKREFKKHQKQQKKSRTNARMIGANGTLANGNGTVNLNPEGHLRQSKVGSDAAGLNTSLDSGMMSHVSYTPKLDPATGNLVQNYQKRSARRRRAQQQQQQSNETITTTVPDEHTLLTSTPNMKPRSRSQSASRHSTTSSERRRQRARSASPLALPDDQQTLDGHSPTSLPPVMLPTIDTVTGKLVYEPLKASSIRDHPRPVPAMGIFDRTHRNSKSNISLQDFEQPDRRLSVTEPRGLRNSNDSVLRAAPGRSIKNVSALMTSTAPPPTNLANPLLPRGSEVAFDVHNSTLIRYQNQVQQPTSQPSSADNSRDVNEPRVQQQQPTKIYQRFAVPPTDSSSAQKNYPDNISPPQSSQDSGHPSGWSSANSDNCNQQKDARLSKGPIGFEPALATGRRPPSYQQYSQQKLQPAAGSGLNTSIQSESPYGYHKHVARITHNPAAAVNQSMDTSPYGYASQARPLRHPQPPDQPKPQPQQPHPQFNSGSLLV